MIALAPTTPTLDKYEVLEEIGHGGMATVYRARDRRLGRDVAVKVIHKHLRENTEVAARFVSEARAVAKLKHQNIVEVYDVSDEGDPERYLVVELVEGTTLRQLLSERKFVPAEIAAAIALEIGAALEHAHAHGVIHRDIKPENVLVNMRPPSSAREGPESAQHARIKIADFGIAKLLDAQGVTSTGQVLGSPAHMAPEQIEGGDVDARSDVFGMGVLVYECMVGRLPFDGKNPAQVLRKVLDGTFTPAERARPSIGVFFSRAVEKALARDQAARFDSVAAFCDVIKRELGRVGFSEPRKELAEFLADPDAYEKSYQDRLVPKLVALGRKSRAERDVPAAAAWFNRALSFRPNDRELLEQVAGMEKRERYRRILLRGGAIALASAGLGLAAFALVRATRQPQLAVLPEPTASAPNRNYVVPPPVAPVPTKQPVVPVPPPDVTGVVPRVPFSAAPVVSGKTRMVRVNITGAGGGKLRVDGADTKWFGRVFELPLGPHQFEFLPPTPECCKKTAVQTVNIVEGAEGEGPQPVTGHIAYLDATVSLMGEGATATCTFFDGPLAAGATRTVTLSNPRTDGTCTITGPDQSGVRREFVTLTPGDRRTLQWN
jgi:serine/threonine-protein kinase